MHAGVVKVLSTANKIFFLLHKFAIPSMSATLSVGLDTHSIKIIFVFFLISVLTESIFVGSANDV